MVDIHSHILHGIADSPPDIQISLEIARLYHTLGFTHVVSTPHYNPAKENIGTFLSICNRKHAELNRLIADMPLTILPGAEVMLCPELLDIRDLGPLCLNHSRYMLVEFPWNQFPAWTQNILFDIGLRGIAPILAHPERNNEIYKNFDRFKDLVAAGLPVQINAYSILSSGRSKKMVKKLFRAHAVTLIGTDTHAPNERLTQFGKATGAIKKRYGAAQIDRILNNAVSVVRNGLIAY